MFILYDIIFIIFAIVYFPVLVLRGKLHKDFIRRFGWPGAKPMQEDPGKKNIWIHAVSVGEVMAVSGLVRKIREDRPCVHFIVSTVTPTGFQVACDRLNDIATIIYAPLDLSWIVRGFIRRIRPALYLSMETEIWPNLYEALHRQRIPVILVNGRISEKTFRGFRRVPWLTKKILDCVDLFCMQSHVDAMRIFQLGAAHNRVKITGNMKFDSVVTTSTVRRGDFGFQEEHLIWIAGSTHPGEEDVVLSFYEKFIREFPRLRLMIAPRHVERASGIEAEIIARDFKCVRYSQIDRDSRSAQDIVLVDTIGQLRDLYGIADFVFIGKSLKGRGGQNIIEPAAFGKAILVGPHMQNFQSVTEQFLESGAIVQVRDEQELENKIRFFLAHPDDLEFLGKAAAELVQASQGAVLDTIEAIRNFLPKDIP